MNGTRLPRLCVTSVRMEPCGRRQESGRTGLQKFLSMTCLKAAMHLQYLSAKCWCSPQLFLPYTCAGVSTSGGQALKFNMKSRHFPNTPNVSPKCIHRGPI